MTNTPRPNTPHDEKRSVKLSLHRIELLRDCYKKYHNYSLVGRIFHVTPSTVMYWVNESFRRNVISKGQEYKKMRMKDPVYRNRINKMKNKSARELRKSQPAIGQWEKDQTKEYSKNNPELVKMWRENNKHKQSTYSHKTYYKNREFLLPKRRAIYHESKANGTNWYYKNRDRILAKMREAYRVERS